MAYIHRRGIHKKFSGGGGVDHLETEIADGELVSLPGGSVAEIDDA